MFLRQFYRITLYFLFADAALRMIMFLRQFYRITLYFLFADAALILKFRKVLGTIGLAPALKKLSRYFLFANTTFEAIFMIKFAKCSHALICYKLFTNATISNRFINCFNLAIA